MPDLQPAQFVDLYHGTRGTNVAGIRREGLRAPAGTGPNWFMLTTSREQAARYSPMEGSQVLHFRVPRSEIWDTQEHRRNPKADPSLWPGHAHDVYDYPATAFGLRKTLSPKYLVED